MKKLLTILFLLQVQVSIAGTDPYFVMSPVSPDIQGNAPSPVEGQNFFLWRRIICSPRIASDVVFSAGEISFFEQFSSVIGDPCPSNYESVATINGMNKGLYNFNYYVVPNTDAFPPNVVDYPLYLLYQNQFQVLADVEIVDASSLWSLLGFSTILLLIGFAFIRRKVKT